VGDTDFGKAVIGPEPRFGIETIFESPSRLRNDAVVATLADANAVKSGAT
jgi:hypothetical protein